MMAAIDASCSVRRAARARRGAVAALLLLYALIYLLPLGVRPLASPDEVRYGEIPREMLTSGDWISPRFNGVRYFEKPPLGYWLNAASLAVLGETPFALRLPVALATGFTALIVFALARRFLTPFSAWLAAGVFLTSFLVAGTGTFAVLDAYLALFLTGALASFYCAIEAEHPSRRRSFLILCGAACGAAFLSKGFLAFALPTVVAVPYLISQRRWRTLLTSAWWPIAIAAVVVLPWAVAIQIREPDFWHYFFWVEHIHRFASSDAQRARPFWFYLACLPLAALPWTAALPAALLGLRQRRSSQPGASAAANALPAAATVERGGRRPGAEIRFLWFLAAWAGMPFLFLSLAKGKLPTYILPCFPPLAILLAAGLERYLAAPRQRAFRIGAGVLAAAFLAASAAVLALQTGAFGRPVFGLDEIAKLRGFVGFMVLGAGCAAFAGLGGRPVPRLAALAVAGAALIVPAEVIVPQRVRDAGAPSTAILRYAHPAPDTLLVSDSPLFGATAWALKRDDIYVVRAGEIEYGLSYPDSRYRRLDSAALVRLIEENRGRHAIRIIWDADTERKFAGLLPASARRSEHGKVVMWRIPAS
jgi:4-amino-4-deoxy-L-arabinose transferase